MIEPDEYGKPLDRNTYKALFDAIGDAYPEDPNAVEFKLPPVRMPEEIDPEKLQLKLEVIADALVALRKVLDLHSQRLTNLEDWVKRLEEKVRIGF